MAVGSPPAVSFGLVASDRAHSCLSLLMMEMMARGLSWTLIK